MGDTNFDRRLLAAPFLMSILRGPELVIEAANPQILRAWRLGPEIIGLPLLKAMPSLVDQPFPGYLEAVLRTGVTYEGREELVQLPNAATGQVEELYFDFVYGALRDLEGVIDGVLVSAFEVTAHVRARKELEAALEEARRERQRASLLATGLAETMERVHAAQQVANIGVFDWDLSAESLTWSPELYRLMGLEPGAIEPSPEAFTNALVHSDRDLGWAEFERAAAEREGSMEVELRLRQPAGNARWVRVSAQIAYDVAGSACRMLGAVVDIQALKEAAAARALALEGAERDSRAKDEVMAAASRELRAPLNAMLGWATVLRGDQVDRGRLDHGLDVIERSAQAQSRMVNDLLDVSRIISGKLRLELETTDPAAVILEAVALARPNAEAHEISLNVELEENLGTLLADAARLRQIVWNLLSNAVKLTPSGGIVTVQADRVKSAFVLSIEDTGPGISAERLPRIFERFQPSVEPTTRAHGGLGLGLAIVRYLVEAHGGTVSAHSAGIGLGATFTVSIPTRAPGTGLTSSEEPEREAPSELPQAKPTSAAALLGYRLLVVEDDSDCLELLQVVLEHAGAVVTCASSAQQALELVSQMAFDGVVSDIGMPEMNGHDFLRRLRLQHTAAVLPAIALTAYTAPEDVQRALVSGFQKHLPKPADAKALVRSLVELAHRH